MDEDREGELIVIDGHAKLYWNGRPGVNRWEHGQEVRILAKAIKRFRVGWEHNERQIVRLVYPNQLVMEEW